MSGFELIALVIGSVAGSSVLTAWITTRAMRKKTSAEAADSVAESAKLLVETMRVDLKSVKEEVDIIRKDNAQKDKEILKLEKRVFELETELRFHKLGGPIAPVATPNA